MDLIVSFFQNLIMILGYGIFVIGVLVVWIFIGIAVKDQIVDIYRDFKDPYRQ